METGKGIDAASKSKITEHSDDKLILAVDDDIIVLNMLKKLLQRIGYKCITASNGIDAIEIFKQYQEDIMLVLLDIIMPGMTGADVFHELRKLHPEIRIVLCSGYSREGIAGSLIEKGATGFLQKPFLLDELKSLLETI